MALSHALARRPNGNGESGACMLPSSVTKADPFMVIVGGSSPLFSDASRTTSGLSTSSLTFSTSWTRLDQLRDSAARQQGLHTVVDREIVDLQRAEISDVEKSSVVLRCITAQNEGIRDGTFGGRMAIARMRNVGIRLVILHLG